MAHQIGDRIKETTTTTGTGNITLAGAVSGFRAFSAVCANNDTIWYVIVHQSANEWEVGLGTWLTGGALARTTVLASSNAGAAVTFSAGTKDVFCDYPAARIGPQGASGQIQYHDGLAAFGGDSAFTFNKTTNALTINPSGVAGTIGIGNTTIPTGATGINNTSLGTGAMDALTSGPSNTAIGTDALGAATTGDSNTCIGAGAGINITTGFNNTIIGKDAGPSINGSGSIVIGAGANPGSVSGVLWIGAAGLITGSFDSGSEYVNVNGRLQSTIPANREIFRLVSTATNDDPTVSLFQNRVATTDELAVTLHSYATSSNQRYAVCVWVLMRRTGGVNGADGDGGFIVHLANARNVAGVVTISNVTSIGPGLNMQGMTVAAVSIEASGTNILVRVNGDPGTNYTWHLVKFEISPLGT